MENIKNGDTQKRTLTPKDELLEQAKKLTHEQLLELLLATWSEAHFMRELWLQAENELKSDDPVEVRLRKDLDDADESYRTLSMAHTNLQVHHGMLMGFVQEVRRWITAEKFAHRQHNCNDPFMIGHRPDESEEELETIALLARTLQQGAPGATS